MERLESQSQVPEVEEETAAEVGWQARAGEFEAAEQSAVQKGRAIGSGWVQRKGGEITRLPGRPLPEKGAQVRVGQPRIESSEIETSEVETSEIYIADPPDLEEVDLTEESPPGLEDVPGLEGLDESTAEDFDDHGFFDSIPASPTPPKKARVAIPRVPPRQPPKPMASPTPIVRLPPIKRHVVHPQGVYSKAAPDQPAAPPPPPVAVSKAPLPEPDPVAVPRLDEALRQRWDSPPLSERMALFSILLALGVAGWWILRLV